MTESPGYGWNHDRHNDKDIDEILTKASHPPSHRKQQQERKQIKGSVECWPKIARKYVCVCVCGVCVCARRCMGLGERTAGKPPYVLSCYYENV